MSYLEGHSPVSPLSSRFLRETTSLDTAGCTGTLSLQNGAALGCRSVCSPQRSVQKYTNTNVHLGGLSVWGRLLANTSFSHLSSSLTHLGQASLAVHDEIPLFSIQAVCHFVLPDKRPVICGRPASCVSSPRSLGDHSTHRLRHTEVHLWRLD